MAGRESSVQSAMASNTQRDKLRAGSLSLVSNVLLASIKLLAAFFTGSVSLLSEGVHSLTDLISSSITLISIRASGVPADDSHPYGHEKIETVASFAESCLMGFLAVAVLVQSAQRLFKASEVVHLTFGLVVLALCAGISLVVGLVVTKASLRTESKALASNGLHLRADALMSVGVLIALLIVQWTHLSRIDSIAGAGLSLWLLFNAWKLGSEAFQQLIDRRLSDEDILKIRNALAKTEGLISYHRLRTRMSGRVRLIEVHLVVPREWSLLQAHALADGFEKQIKAIFDHVTVISHVDPYDQAKAEIGRSNTGTSLASGWDFPNKPLPGS